MWSRIASWFAGSGIRQWRAEDDDWLSDRLGELEASDWSAFRAAYDRLPNSSDRHFAIESLTKRPGRPKFLDAWVESEPDAFLPLLLRGAHSVAWAWEARTGARANDVAEDAWAVFFERLGAAKRDLERAAELGHNDPTPYGSLVTVAKGAQLGIPTALQYLEAARAIDTHHVGANVAYLTMVAEKWHGSHDLMFDHARSTSNAAPDGSEVHVLIPMAHIERWTFALHFDEDHRAANVYWQDERVRDEVVEAYERSLGSAGFDPTHLTPGLAGHFAYALTRVGANEAARREFERIGPLYREMPWAMVGDPHSVFRNCRKRVGV